MSRSDSRACLNDTMKLADLENPSLVQEYGIISYTGRIIANFVFKTQIFVTLATGVPEDIIMTPLSWPTPETPFGTEIWELYLYGN